MIDRKQPFISGGAAFLGLRLALACLAPIATATPVAAAAPHETPLALARQREALTAGGFYDPTAPADKAFAVPRDTRLR